MALGGIALNLSVGQMVIILSPKIEYETFGTIRQITEDKLLVSPKSLSLFPKHSEVLCIVVDGQNMYEFYSTVDDFSNEIIFIEKPIRNSLVEIEKRRFNRTDCHIGMLGTTTAYKGQDIDCIGKKFTGTIIDISAGGVLIETGLNLPIGMEFYFKLKLNNFIECNAIVRRSSRAFDDLYQCGCEFFNMDIKDIKTISMFVFKQQLKNKRKEIKNRVSEVSF